MKKEIPKKMKPRFKNGETVWDPHIGKKVKYKHERDCYKFHLRRLYEHERK